MRLSLGRAGSRRATERGLHYSAFKNNVILNTSLVGENVFLTNHFELNL